MKKNILTVLFFAISFVLLFFWKNVFTAFFALISLITFYEIIKKYKVNRSIPLYIEVLNYLSLIFITFASSQALDYRLLAALVFVNLIPIIFHQSGYELKDAFYLLGFNIFISSAFSSLLYIGKESVYETFYVLLIVLVCKIFYFLGNFYIGKNYNRLGFSYEGIVCSILMSTFISSIFYLVFINSFNSDIFIVIISFILAIFSNIGELMFIYVNKGVNKKNLDSKESSSGKIFNRASSIMFVTLAYMIIRSIL